MATSVHIKYLILGCDNVRLYLRIKILKCKLEKGFYPFMHIIFYSCCTIQLFGFSSSPQEESPILTPKNSILFSHEDFNQIYTY